MLSKTDLDNLALTLHDIGAIQLGNFTLHSGKTSPIYLDLRLLVSYPAALKQATQAYRAMLEKLTFDLLAAAPLAGLPIGTAICLDMNIPLIYPRKTAKTYGTGKSIEGKWQVGQTAVIIDDLVTSGDSIMQVIAPVKASGLMVQDAVVLIDRQQGGADNLRKAGYRLHAVMTISQLLSSLEENGRINTDQRAQILRAIL